MLIVSISRTDAAPTPMATARRRMIGARRSRWAADSVLESRTPGILRTRGFMITAPSRQWTFSYRRLGTRGAIGVSGYPRRGGQSAAGARAVDRRFAGGGAG